jgi:hypothetical protein
MTQNASQNVPFPSEDFTRKAVTVDAPSGRTYVLRELNGYEQMQSDGGLETQGEIITYRVVMALEKVNNETIAPRVNRAALDMVLKRIPGVDLDFLMVKYATEFSPTKRVEELKKGSTPSDQ